MFIEYEAYIERICSNLLQCGVPMPTYLTSPLDTYEKLFKAGYIVDDLLYFYRVMEISGSSLALNNTGEFFIPLYQYYKDRLRVQVYEEFLSELPELKRLWGEGILLNMDEIDLDDYYDYEDEDIYEDESDDFPGDDTIGGVIPTEIPVKPASVMRPNGNISSKVYTGHGIILERVAVPNGYSEEVIDWSQDDEELEEDDGLEAVDWSAPDDEVEEVDWSDTNEEEVLDWASDDEEEEALDWSNDDEEAEEVDWSQDEEEEVVDWSSDEDEEVLDWSHDEDEEVVDWSDSDDEEVVDWSQDDEELEEEEAEWGDDEEELDWSADEEEGEELDWSNDDEEGEEVDWSDSDEEEELDWSDDDEELNWADDEVEPYRPPVQQTNVAASQSRGQTPVESRDMSDKMTDWLNATLTEGKKGIKNIGRYLKG